MERVPQRERAQRPGARRPLSSVFSDAARYKICAAVTRPPTDARRILIIKPSSLGDIVHALPVLAALREAYPDAYIAWMVATPFVDLLRDHPMLDEVIPFDRRRYGRMWYNPAAALDFWRFVWRVRRKRFDLIVDLQGLIRSGLLSLFSGAKTRIGFADAHEGAWLFYTRRVRCPREAEHAVDRNLCLACGLGLDVTTPRFPLAVTPQEKVEARNLLAGGADSVPASFTAVVPGARWPSKIWPAEHYADLIDRLERPPAHRCVLLGSPQDRALANQIAKRCRSQPIDLVGHTTLRQLTALLSLAREVVCGDSGPMHIAAALGRPVWALFGPTNPRRTGPYGDTARILMHAVPCAPCYRRVCPLGHQECLRGLRPQQVLGPVRETAPLSV